jgi:hypothetical protein
MAKPRKDTFYLIMEQKQTKQRAVRNIENVLHSPTNNWAFS